MNLRKRCCLGILTLVALVCAWPRGNFGADPGPEMEKKNLAAGKELFTREWLPGDRRSHAGDGLGPVFNARSCVACHHQGGVGGAGPKESNVTLVSAFVTMDGSMPKPNPAKATKQPDRAKLAKIHPNLRTESSFPFHRFGPEKEFEKWKVDLFHDKDTKPFDSSVKEDEELAEILSQIRSILIRSTMFSGAGLDGGRRKVDGVDLALVLSQRNPPALFGAGLIDRIPDRVLEEVAGEQARFAIAGPKDVALAKAASRLTEDFLGFGKVRGGLTVTGRVARLKDGRIGRFGWKAHVATLREFTLQACSTEIGLEVPGFARAAPPWKKNYKAPGLDMTAEQCDLLVRFVASLPSPASRAPETPQHAAEIAAGQKLFAKAGCTACHRQKLGDVQGIYSDLLLHDMGQALSDAGSYGTSIPVTAAGAPAEPLPVLKETAETATKEKPPKFGANAAEWRTPPLWGLRDSGPYLHDGRAETIAEAVALHGGEGLIAALAFFNLTSRERQQVELFLESLAAPATLE